MPTPISALLHAATCAISLFIILDTNILSSFFALIFNNIDQYKYIYQSLILWNKPKTMLSKFDKIYLTNIEKKILN